MDMYTIGEEAYKNGFSRGYEEGFKDAVLGRNSTNCTSSRKGKWDVLTKELAFWGYEDWHPDTIEAVRTIANELSWRVIMRIVHKLRRKRGAE